MNHAVDYMAKGLKLAEHAVVEYEAPINIIGSVKVKRSLQIGCYTYIVGPSRFGNVSALGRYCSVAPDVSLGPYDHPTDWLSTSPFQYSRSKFAFSDWHREFKFTRRTADTDRSKFSEPVVIGNDVWIGAGAVILNGVTIGDGSIVAAGSVVTKSIPPYSIVGGVPAKVIRMRFGDALIRTLLDLQWWRYDARDLSGLPFDSPEKAIDLLRARIEAGGVRERPVSFKEINVWGVTGAPS